jgi:uncharacterized protein YecE (DUF72 family)
MAGMANEMYVDFNNNYQGYAVRNAARMRQLLDV